MIAAPNNFHQKHALFIIGLMIAWAPSQLVVAEMARAQMVVAQMAQAQTNSTQTVKWSGSGLSFELAPLTPDLVRAFFIGRGFPKKDVELLAGSACVFRSAIGHADNKKSAKPVTIELNKWRVIKGGKPHPLRTREKWKEIWTKRGLGPSAQIAFHWALIPTEQTYQQTDYNWGMLSFMEKPGTEFDLEIAWLQGVEPRTHIFKGLICGQDAKE